MEPAAAGLIDADCLAGAKLADSTIVRARAAPNIHSRCNPVTPAILSWASVGDAPMLLLLLLLSMLLWRSVLLDRGYGGGSDHSESCGNDQCVTAVIMVHC